MMERGHDTKERILDTSQALILENGFAATSLHNILKTTGVTKGAFFHHFDSKRRTERVRSGFQPPSPGQNLLDLTY